MESLELFFRFGGIAILLAQTALIGRRARSLAAARYYGLMGLGLIGFLATHASVDLSLPAPIYYPLSVLSKATALAIWWFIFSIFEDDFRLGRLEIGFAAIWLALIPFDFTAVSQLSPDLAELASSVRIVMSIGLAVYILARLLADYGVDLVASRRRARLWAPSVILGLFVIDLASDYLTGYGAPPLTYSVIQKAAIFSFVFAVLLLSVTVNLDRLSPASKPAIKSAAFIKDPVLLARLQAALDAGVYLDPELSLSALAKQLSATEARLRTLINQDLGYRNFRTFLNQHRVEAAKTALADPAWRDKPIIAIALDTGFNALASFNRVFKDMTGQTPSAYRASKLR